VSALGDAMKDDTASDHTEKADADDDGEDDEDDLESAAAAFGWRRSRRKGR